MKARFRPLLYLLPITAVLLGAVQNRTNPKEEEEVRQALSQYLFEGLRTGDTELLDQVIHPKWRLFNVDGDRLVQYGRSDFYSWLSGEDKGEARLEILSVDITGPVASVKTREDSGDHYWIDYLHLAKIDGRWWIVEKVAHPVQRDGP